MRLQQTVPIMGVYDDHDYGKDDGDKTFDPRTRAASQQLLLDFLDEPATSPRRKQRGVYQHYVLGSAPRRVHVILLDNRTWKDQYNFPPGDEQDMLGPEQWAWLEHVLRTTEAEVTIIGAGLQIVSHGDPLISESWSLMPQSRAKLMALLAATKTEGAFFVSGG